MFREMRRAKQALTADECVRILQEGTSGVLALCGDDAYPYAVPMSYAYADGCLYFHSALAGHKVDAINGHDKASFCVISQDNVMPEKYTTSYQSVIVFGRIAILEGEEARAGAMLIGQKYAPGADEKTAEYVEHDMGRMNVIRLRIEHLTGKEGMELVKARRAAQDPR